MSIVYRKRAFYLPVEEAKMRCEFWTPTPSSQGMPALIWIHGGGFSSGSERNLGRTLAGKAAKEVPLFLISPGYRKMGKGPYPLQLNDCYACYRYVYEHADKLGIDRNRIMVGGESAGGNLAAAVAIKARDEHIASHYQFLLYPMLSPVHTPSHDSKKAKGWTKKRNDRAWAKYLSNVQGEVPALAAPSLLKDYSHLPPCYAMVLKEEIFYRETVDYVSKIEKEGIEAHVDVYDGGLHAFDQWLPFSKRSKKAAKDFLAALKLALS